MPLGAKRGMISPIGSAVQRASAAVSWWLSGGISAANCIAAYQAKGAASLAASYSNLNSPGSYDASTGTAPGWDAGTGWQFTAASSQYLIAGNIVGASGYSMFVRFSNASGTGSMGLAGASSAPRFYLRPRYNNASQRVYGYGGSALVKSGALESGVMGIAATNCYLNGSPDGTAGTWSGTGQKILIGCENISSGVSPGNYFTGYIQAMAIYSSTLSDEQVTALTTAMNAL